jgi:hypothetical protein
MITWIALMVATQLEVWARELTSWITDGLQGLSVGDWVLIALALSALYWVWAGLYASTRVGPVEVKLLECDDGNPAKVHALTALLRERLANSGLPPPPAVPAGAPQTDLVSAVAASPIPQANWIASIIRLLRPPQPLQYELSGTIFGQDEEPNCGLSFWLRPSRAGRELLGTVGDVQTHETAVLLAASRIYLHISNEAVHAFPVWTRWHHKQALDKYAEGRMQAIKGERGAALTSLSDAAALEPGNALAQLQLANLCEQVAKHPTEQADVLRRYLDAAVEWPWLVQARYRVSVLAGVLACSLEVPVVGNEEPEGLAQRLRMPGVSEDSLVSWLQNLANRESEAVLQLLDPWYALLCQRRLRFQFEPRGAERRELKRTVNISKHCLRVRRSFDTRGWWTPLKIRISELVVHHWHLSTLRGGVSSQTHYVAACFDALLLEREKLLRERS